MGHNAFDLQLESETVQNLTCLVVVVTQQPFSEVLTSSMEVCRATLHAAL